MSELKKTIKNGEYRLVFNWLPFLRPMLDDEYKEKLDRALEAGSFWLGYVVLDSKEQYDSYHCEEVKSV